MSKEERKVQIYAQENRSLDSYPGNMKNLSKYTFMGLLFINQALGAPFLERFENCFMGGVANSNDVITTIPLSEDISRNRHRVVRWKYNLTYILSNQINLKCNPSKLRQAEEFLVTINGEKYQSSGDRLIPAENFGLYEPSCEEVSHHEVLGTSGSGQLYFAQNDPAHEDLPKRKRIIFPDNRQRNLSFFRDYKGQLGLWNVSVSGVEFCPIDPVEDQGALIRPIFSNGFEHFKSLENGNVRETATFIYQYQGQWLHYPDSEVRNEETKVVNCQKLNDKDPVVKSVLLSKLVEDIETGFEQHSYLEGTSNYIRRTAGLRTCLNLPANQDIKRAFQHHQFRSSKVVEQMISDIRGNLKFILPDSISFPRKTNQR